MSRFNPATKQAIARPGWRFMMSHYSHVIAQGFGSGLSPIMPGTCGTLFGALVFVQLTKHWPGVFTPVVWASIILIGFVLGIKWCNRTGRDIGVADHGSIVWDEIIAIWLVFLFLWPANFATQCLAFLVFRFFDMVKPAPIGWFDQHFKGGFGVMWDDIVAAFYTLLVFAFWRAL